jgi:uncharacterized membrane protein
MLPNASISAVTSRHDGSMIPGIELHRTSGPALLGLIAVWWTVVVAAAISVARSGRAAIRMGGSAPTPQMPPRPTSVVGSGRAIWVAVLFVVLAGAAIRLQGLGAKSVSHPEMLMPGIDLPTRLSEPPARTTFMETVWFHFHVEPHPPGYFIAMHPWGKLFGTRPAGLRLPSALAGIATIWVVYWLGAAAFAREVGLLGAALLALHGYHAYSSQIAQHYAVAAMLAMASTATLWHLSRATRSRAALEVGYVLLAWAGLFTQAYFWLLVFCQIVWVTLVCPERRRVLQLQALTVLLALPALAQLLYRGPPFALPVPSFLVYLGASDRAFEAVDSLQLFPAGLNVVAGYLSFAFLFADDLLSDPVRHVPLWSGMVLAPLGFVLVVSAWRGRGTATAERPALLPGPALWPFVLASMVLLEWFARLALRRWELIRLLIVVAPLLLLMPPVLAALGRLVERSAVGGWLRRRDAALLLTLASLGTLAGLLPLAYGHNVLAVRLLLFLTPPLILLMAAGWRPLLRRSVVGVLATGVLLATFAVSLFYYRAMPVSLRDYRAVAQEMQALSEQGDVVFAKRHWTTTPIFYYLRADRFRFALWRRSGRLLRDPSVERFWALRIHRPERPPTAPAGFHFVRHVEARGMYAFLYQRDVAAAAESEIPRPAEPLQPSQ